MAARDMAQCLSQGSHGDPEAESNPDILSLLWQYRGLIPTQAATTAKEHLSTVVISEAIWYNISLVVASD